jgi:hypothetical protein
MQLVDLVGFSAAGASLVAFSAKTMIPLRAAAICSNVLFVSYGVLTGFWPSALLHIMLLPLNVHRLLAMRRLVKRVEVAAKSEHFDVDWLRPYMKRKVFKAGDLVFRKGDPASDVYFIVSGLVLFPEAGTKAGDGLLFGEIGLFTPEGRRTLSCVCETDVEVLRMTNEELKELYFQHPDFGFQLVMLIVGRMKAQIERLGEQVARNELKPT